MKNYIITNKKGEKTRVIADSLDDAIQIYNKKYTKDSIYIYQFPSFTDEDLKESKKYNLTLVNKTNNGNAKLKGELEDLKRFAKEYLDYQLVEKYLIEDSIVKDSSIELDWAGPIRDIEYLAKKYNCTYTRVGTENGYPVIKFIGTRQNLQKLCKQYGMDKEDFEEFVEN